MKKRILLIILALLVLSACSHKNKNQKVPGNWYTGSSSSTSASDKKETSDNSIYDVVLEKLRTDTSDTPATHYAYYDIDGNGQDELFSGRYWESTGTIEFAALYYDNNGVADYLAQSYVASVGGYREAANIYTDGTIITAKWMSTGTQMEDTQYQLRADNSGVDVIKNANVPIGRDVELSDYF
ncbi:MAG: lipoprotein, partial [Streptococcus infantarius]|nr:lipoprotein [Streptococcus infantarius]